MASSDENGMAYDAERLEHYVDTYVSQDLHQRALFYTDEGYIGISQLSAQPGRPFMTLT
jgi:hypothetical protein